jgi:Stigma-specific protein, Stig1
VTSSFANNMVLAVQGTAASVEQALRVNLDNYLRPDGTQFYSLDRDPSLDLADAVLGIQGLDNFVLPKAAILGNGILMGNDFNVAYDGAYGSVSCGSQTGLYGSGQSIGIFSFTPQVPGAGFSQGDISSYVQNSHINSESSVFDGITPTAPIVVPVGVPLSATTPPSGANTLETSMDIEMAYSMAPQAQVYVFEGANVNDIFSAMATQAGSATPHINQLTSSWFQCDDLVTQQIVYEFAAQGQSLFVSSGDNGAYPEDPSIEFGCTANQLNTTDLDGATIVGGTQLTLQGPSSNYPVQASAEAWNSEASWSCAAGAAQCSGGGVLTTQPLPIYQTGLSSLNGQVSSTHRNVPDVAMAATNIADYCNLGQADVSGGTSASSPLWAGYMALVNEENASHGTTIGFANPAIYAIGENATAYAASFHDIAGGQTNQSTSSNGVSYSAVAGYDLVTGWGSPTCQLINNLACATTCGTSLCVDLDTSASHCGTCTNACGTGLSCCAASCSALTTDPNNCGACGHGCLGGTCAAGVCQPLVLAPVADGIGITVDATNVYWTDRGTSNFTGFVRRVSKLGGSVITLASSLTVPVDIAVGNNQLFWNAGADPGGEAILTMSNTGGAVTTFEADNSVVDLVTDSRNVYWVDGANGVKQAPFAGGTPTTLAATHGGGSAIATDGVNVYWTDAPFDTPSTIFKLPIGGTTITALTAVPDDISPGGLATDGTNVYWIETSPAGTARIGSVPVAGGPITTSNLSAPPLIGGASIAVDSTSVYWYISGSIMRARLPVSNASAGTVMASTTVESIEIAQDATALYWTAATGVMKLAK